MPWFQKTCRQLGLITREIVKPVDPRERETQTLKHEVKEQRLSDTTTLRRTTIEEIEVKTKERL